MTEKGWEKGKSYKIGISYILLRDGLFEKCIRFMRINSLININ